MRMLLSLGLVFCVAYSDIGLADELSKEQFERLFYEPQTVGRLGIYAERFRSLGARKQKALLEARATLMGFFAATQALDQDPREFLGGPLASKFKNRAQVGEALFGLETELLVASVIDFELPEQDSLELKYYVVVFSEGTMLLRQGQSRLKRVGASWKVVRIGGIE